MPSRRSWLQGGLAFASSTYLPAARAQRSVDAGLPDVLRPPDFVSPAAGLQVKTRKTATGLRIDVAAARGVEPNRIHLRWRGRVTGDLLVLADAWERSYGELAWRSIVPERVMPWYFLVFDGKALHGVGVKTQAAALCFWQLDANGISLWLDVSNGGMGVQLGDRLLQAAEIVTRAGSPDEKPLEAASAFCRLLCERPRLPEAPLYGSNDWYYAYGKNSAEFTLRDASLVAELSHGNRVRPFTVIDMGWKDGSPTFPSMPDLARKVKAQNVRPGLWIRPLEAPKDAPVSLLLPSARFGKMPERAHELAFDPTIPEALEMVIGKVKNPMAWGYELVKHDFSTYDLLGRWGREMGAEPTYAGWHLHDRTRTNAEVMLALYRALREAAGEKTLLIGCNTVGHLGAGLFESQRTGDDTSGRVWERTRRMGVNTIAFRLPQHNAFFAMDPDCVGITKAIPWELNRQWLDLVARSGAALFISPGADATGQEQRAAVKESFAMAAAQTGTALRATPQYWFRDSAPEAWTTDAGTSTYHWDDGSGCPPFEI